MYFCICLIIYVGVNLIIDSYRRDPDQWLQRPLPIGEDGKRICCSVHYGGDEYVYHGETFHGARLDAFCGGIRMDVQPGDAVIATAAVRAEGTSREYAPLAYPAAADYYVTRALEETAVRLGLRHEIGVVQCKDSFYGQHRPEVMPVAEELKENWTAWKRLGVLASEMESAALFVASAHLGVRCGAVLHVVWNQERAAAGIREESSTDTDGTLRIALEAISSL